MLSQLRPRNAHSSFTRRKSILLDAAPVPAWSHPAMSFIALPAGNCCAQVVLGLG